MKKISQVIAKVDKNDKTTNKNPKEIRASKNFIPRLNQNSVSICKINTPKNSQAESNDDVTVFKNLDSKISKGHIRHASLPEERNKIDS